MLKKNNVVGKYVFKLNENLHRSTSEKWLVAQRFFHEHFPMKKKCDRTSRFEFISDGNHDAEKEGYTDIKCRRKKI